MAKGLSEPVAARHGRRERSCLWRLRRLSFRSCRQWCPEIFQDLSALELKP